MIFDLLCEVPRLVKKIDGQIISECAEVTEEEVITAVPLSDKFVDLEDKNTHRIYRALSLIYLNVVFKGMQRKHTIQVVSLINKNNLITHWLVPCELSVNTELISNGYVFVRLLTKEDAVRILNKDAIY